ncbi:MAG: glycosyltransferase family 4 protein [Flavobacteriaceae bacterium]
MNVLIVGANTKMARVFQNFANIVILDNKDLRSYEEISDFRVIKSTISDLNYFSLMSRALELKKIAKSNHIDVVFTNEKISMIAAFLAFSFSLKKITLLSTSHSSYAWMNERNVKVFSKIVGICTHGFISLSSHVTALLIRNGLKKRKILTTVNPIEQNIFKFKKNYSLSSTISMVYVGVINPRKGQDVLLKALKQLKSEGVNFMMHFYGDFLDNVFYENLIGYVKLNQLEKHVQFHGRIDNSLLRYILCDYDIYICPSEMEMSPYNLIEAKATGLPIIASNVGGIPDIISNDIDGILVAPGSQVELTKAIKQLINNDKIRENIGKNAYLSSKTKHSPNSLSNNLQLFISQL